MPSETRWLLEDRILFSHHSGVMSDEDIQKMDAETLAYLEASSAQLVHHIIDSRAITKAASIRQTMQVKAPYHPRTGWVITIGASQNPLVRFLTALVTSATKLRYREVATFEDALALLQQLDTTLPDLAASEKEKAAQL
jgi:hypothetical protein